MNLTTILQVIGFLASHKDDIKQLILSLEQVVIEGVTLAGGSKADVVKGYIAVATNTVAEIETVWPVVKPAFDAIVALVKGKTA